MALGSRLKGRKRCVNCSPRSPGQVAAKDRCSLSGQWRPGRGDSEPQAAGQALGTGKRGSLCLPGSGHGHPPGPA